MIVHKSSEHESIDIIEGETPPHLPSEHEIVNIIEGETSSLVSNEHENIDISKVETFLLPITLLNMKALILLKVIPPSLLLFEHERIHII